MADKKHLIYKEDLLDLFTVQAPSMSYNKMFMAVADAPTVDAVEVVRCNGCRHSKLPAVLTQKYGEPGTLTCHNWHSPCNKRNVNQNDFCSYGERRTDDKETG